jgi:hypothetical protein
MRGAPHHTCNQAALFTCWHEPHAGYHYTAPFFSKDIVDTRDSHVRPLFQHLFHPKYREGLTFIGLPYKTVPFPQFELQSKLVARLLSGKILLPDRVEMEKWMTDHYECASSPLSYSIFI